MHTRNRCAREDCLDQSYGIWVALDAAFVLVALVLTIYVEPVAQGSGVPGIKLHIHIVIILNYLFIYICIYVIIGLYIAKNYNA